MKRTEAKSIYPTGSQQRFGNCLCHNAEVTLRSVECLHFKFSVNNKYVKVAYFGLVSTRIKILLNPGKMVRDCGDCKYSEVNQFFIRSFRNRSKLEKTFRNQLMVHSKFSYISRALVGFGG